VPVDELLRVQGLERVWALGDCAAVPNLATPGQVDPPTQQHALRQARRLAKNLAGDPKPYRYKMLGQVATLGRYKGIADVLGLRFRGFVGWFITRTYHLYQLPLFSRKLRVVADWTTSLSSSAATSPSCRCSAIRGASMREDLARAYSFLARGDMGGTREVESPVGRAVYTDELPRRLDGNYLWVDREAEPEELVDEAARLKTPADLRARPGDRRLARALVQGAGLADRPPRRDGAAAGAPDGGRPLARARGRGARPPRGTAARPRQRAVGLARGARPDLRRQGADRRTRHNAVLRG
jgi:hypothetical protein